MNDLARCAVRAGAQDDNIVTDCVGPTTYSFDDLLDLIAQVLRKKTRFVHLPPAAALLCSKTIGALVRDTTVTQDEMSALTGNLLASETPPAGDVTLDWWLAENKITLGMSYAKGADRRPRR